MTDTQLGLILAAANTALGAILATMVIIYNNRHSKDIKVLTEQTDGKLQALTEAVKGKATAEGELKGHAEARAEAKEDAKSK